MVFRRQAFTRTQMMKTACNGYGRTSRSFAVTNPFGSVAAEHGMNFILRSAQCCLFVDASSHACLSVCFLFPIGRTHIASPCTVASIFDRCLTFERYLSNVLILITPVDYSGHIHIPNTTRGVLIYMGKHPHTVDTGQILEGFYGPQMTILASWVLAVIISNTTYRGQAEQQVVTQ